MNEENIKVVTNLDRTVRVTGFFLNRPTATKVTQYVAQIVAQPVFCQL
jgi:hypothetical protein